MMARKEGVKVRRAQESVTIEEFYHRECQPESNHFRDWLQGPEPD